MTMKISNNKERICKECGKQFKPRQWNQVYCGSKTQKEACSYKRHLERVQEYNNTKGKNKIRKLQKEWMKKQRKENTDYAQRQRKAKREYGKTKKGKEVSNHWRRINTKKVQKWNKKRVLQKRGIKGSHTEQEWQDLKKKHNYCCIECGIPEKELKKKWSGTFFTKLTEDHIIPLSKCGTDYIENIQPLCVSCNARKKDKLWEKRKIIVAVSGFFNPIHKGHIKLFKEAKKLGDKLVVIINSDYQVKIKGSIPFMNEKERVEIIKSFQHVDEVVISIDRDKTVRDTLALVSPDIFANGGDRKNIKEIPETEVCKRLKIKQVFNVGGGKIQSSSWLIDNILPTILPRLTKEWEEYVLDDYDEYMTPISFLEYVEKIYVKHRNTTK